MDYADSDYDEEVDIEILHELFLNGDFDGSIAAGLRAPNVENEEAMEEDPVEEDPVEIQQEQLYEKVDEEERLQNLVVMDDMVSSTVEVQEPVPRVKKEKKEKKVEKPAVVQIPRFNKIPQFDMSLPENRFIEISRFEIDYKLSWAKPQCTTSCTFIKPNSDVDTVIVNPTVPQIAQHMAVAGELSFKMNRVPRFFREETIDYPKFKTLVSENPNLTNLSFTLDTHSETYNIVFGLFTINKGKDQKLDKILNPKMPPSIIRLEIKKFIQKSQLTLVLSYKQLAYITVHSCENNIDFTTFIDPYIRQWAAKEREIKEWKFEFFHNEQPCPDSISHFDYKDCWALVGAFEDKGPKRLFKLTEYLPEDFVFFSRDYPGLYEAFMAEKRVADEAEARTSL